MTFSKIIELCYVIPFRDDVDKRTKSYIITDETKPLKKYSYIAKSGRDQ